MNRSARITVLAVFSAGLAVTMSGCHQLEARDQLNKGVDAFKSAHYEEAIGHFQRAEQLDPHLSMAKTYLAKALEQDVTPGLDTPENLKIANRAIDLFKEVVDKHPDDVNSMKEIAGIYLSVKQLDKAKEWQERILSVNPDDADAAYTIGVIDWTEAHENLLRAFQPLGLTDDGEGNVKAPKSVMEPLAQENAPLVSEALDELHRAVEEKPNFDDAMTYLNLVYRKKADVDYGDPQAVKEDLAEARKWSAEAMGARKANEEKKNAGPGGIVLNNGAK